MRCLLLLVLAIACVGANEYADCVLEQESCKKTLIETEVVVSGVGPCGPDDICGLGQYCSMDVVTTETTCKTFTEECNEALEIAKCETNEATDNENDDGGETTSAEDDGEETTSDSGGNAGRDWHTHCCMWAYDGACDGPSYAFARTVCQKSCGTSPCRYEEVDSCVVSVDPTISEETCAPLRARSANQPPVPAASAAAPETTSTPCSNNDDANCIPLSSTASSESKTDTETTSSAAPTTDCSDTHNDCAQWAATGECEANPYWMKMNCRQSCSCCDCTYASIAGLSYTDDCKDNAEHCPYWASIGECEKNADYMSRECAAACKAC